MSILVQYPHCSLLSQSSMQHQRPTHSPSKNLSEKDIQCLYDLLGKNCVTLATSVAQILHGCDHIWKKQACGVLCYIKDYSRRMYCFRLYNLRSKESIYEEITLASLSLKKVSDLFYTFDGTKCKVGINFVDQIEAETFCKHFHEKQIDRQRKIQLQKLTNTSISAMINGMTAPANNIIKTSIPSSTSPKQLNSKVPKDHGKKRHSLAISEPIRSSFQHVIHVAENESFLTDTTKKQLFDEVLSGMHISPEEEHYIRRTIHRTNNGLEKLFMKSSCDRNTQEPQIFDCPPQIPPRIRNTQKRTSNQGVSHPSATDLHTPLQDTCDTPKDSKQSEPPVIPPRPTRRVPDNTQESIRTSPPPLPANLFHPKENLGGPSPTFTSEQATNEPSLSSNSLLKEICNFNTVQLKSTAQRPIPVIKSNGDAHNTLEENIRQLLGKRRMDIMGRDDEDDETDSNDDDWDT